ncbi:4-hydroxy-tetrahydrodipicolinate reductase [Peptoniphilus indolicus]|uniref:4-hydroxy-tetrahydrodipicolinate reductase n=2 Tax=Peptoniphilus indolicus TaxID=33030 RepID=G4D3S9_9FIRM|nr:4-hydroxy-tetrahydrodipicolinate reductase [Peptoniphilus indolicus]EGY79826.1 dihydrodipicolinate reductase [Peptoniphilus indolicus ATCC 29427]SUB75753.1 Dihydrodipicolinate reductase [Peptoniphilus indolicus]
MRIFLVGITGAMGSTVLSLTNEVVAGYASESKYINGIKVYDKFEDVAEEFDVILDFSNRNITNDVLCFAKRVKKPLVIATTGLDSEIEGKILELSKEISIVYSKNFSMGMNVMSEVVKVLTKALKEFDIEIIEKHHNQKVDAPSGTAKMLFDSVKEERENAEAVYDRTQMSEKRKAEEVGISVVRAGSIVGEHSVIFAGLDEVLEIKHQAGSKKIFASGALKACEFIVERSNGIYDMKDVMRG